MPALVVATFNVHAGVDGWGKSFDVVSACAELNADLLVLQETWTPCGETGLASLVATSLGYEAHEARLSGGVLLDAVAAPGPGWRPRAGDRLHPRCLWLADSQPGLLRLEQRFQTANAKRGTWSIAILSRLPVSRVEVIDLGRLRRDRAESRAAVLVEIQVGDSRPTVVGTHLPHFTQGSTILLERLRKHLPAAGSPAVLAGDMNFWGPPLSLALPGWRRAVRARTYPSWRPHSQVDHIFVTRAVKVISGEAVSVGNSDHRPLRARLAVS